MTKNTEDQEQFTYDNITSQDALNLLSLLRLEVLTHDETMGAFNGIIPTRFKQKPEEFNL